MMLRIHSLHALALSALLAATASAQQNTAQQPTGAPAGSMVLNTGTQLVVVDVVVEDSNGKPVHGHRRLAASLRPRAS